MCLKDTINLTLNMTSSIDKTEKKKLFKWRRIDTAETLQRKAHIAEFKKVTIRKFRWMRSKLCCRTYKLSNIRSEGHANLINLTFLYQELLVHNLYNQKLMAIIQISRHAYKNLMSFSSTNNRMKKTLMMFL